jgi:hypothetical protein
VKFIISKSIDKDKAFIVRKSDLGIRWDPYYFIPSLVALEDRVKKVTPNRLRDFVLRMSGGATPSTSESDTHYTEASDGIPFIRVQNLSTSGKLDLQDCKRITRSTHKGLLARSRLFGGELLVKITGVGRMAIASVVPEGFEANINQHIVAIKTDGKKTSEALAAYMNLDIAEHLASRRSTGGTRPALDYPALLSIPIVYDEQIPRLISIAVQRFDKQNVAAKELLSQLDGLLLRELGITLPPELPNTAESRIFRRRFLQITGGRFDPLYHQGKILNFLSSGEYKIEPLRDHVKYFLTGFAAGRSDQGEAEEGILQIRPTNLSEDRELIFDRNVFIPVSELARRQSDVLKRGEILFNNTNSQELVGKSVYFDLEGKYFCSNHITRIATKQESVEPRFLCHLLNLYQRRGTFYKLCVNWNNQSGVGVDILRDIPIPIPKLQRQFEIVTRLDQIRVKAHDMRREAEEELREAKRRIETIILSQS